MSKPIIIQSMRWPVDLYEEIKAFAEDHGLSMTGAVVLLITWALREREGRK